MYRGWCEMANASDDMQPPCRPSLLTQAKSGKGTELLEPDELIDLITQASLESECIHSIEAFEAVDDELRLDLDFSMLGLYGEDALPAAQKNDFARDICRKVTSDNLRIVFKVWV